MTKINVVEALKKSRLKSVDLDDGLKIFFTRPPEVEMAKYLHASADETDTVRWGISVEEMKRYVTGWEGFTEATFLGSSIGASDPEPFSKELFSVWIDDNAKHATRISGAIIDSMVDFINAKEKVSGN